MRQHNFHYYAFTQTGPNQISHFDGVITTGGSVVTPDAYRIIKKQIAEYCKVEASLLTIASLSYLGPSET